MKNSVKRASFALLAAGFAACTPPWSRPALPEPQPPPADQAAARESPAMATDRALRASIPSFVGLGLGLDGQLLVTLANEADVAAAQRLTDEAWSRAATEQGYTPVRRPRFQAILAAIGPQDLAAAFTAMRDVLTLPSVVFLDLDEICGCIAVGISNASAEAAVSAFATRRGIRQGAVRTVLTAPIVRRQSLRARARPTVGGMEITPRVGGAAVCTLGLPVYHFGQSVAGFLTASHCTNQQGGVEATRFYQEAAPTPGSITAGTPAEPQPVARETADPPLFDQSSDTACPTGRRCRYTDVAFAAYLDPNFGRIGRVARPATSCGAMNCALAVTRPTDDIRVTLASFGAVMGDTIHKIGRTTGWTSGRVSRACVNQNVVNADLTDSGITLICQYVVDAPSGVGDSGSPVFLFSPATGTASFEGVLWGGAATGPSNFSYSPVVGIQREFGSIVFNQQGLASPFFSDGRFYTSNVDDDMGVIVQRNAVPADQVEFVLNGGSSITAPKEIVLVEGTNPPATGNGRWTIGVTRNGDTDGNGLYLYQLPGGHLEFRRREPGSNAMIEVSRVPIDNIPPGTRITFTWEHD